MKFIELLRKYRDNKTRVLVNGYGTGTKKGTVLEVHDDYIEYELMEVKTEKTQHKEKQIKEVLHIPIIAITQISEGEKVKESTNEGLSAFTQPQPQTSEEETSDERQRRII